MQSREVPQVSSRPPRSAGSNVRYRTNEHAVFIVGADVIGKGGSRDGTIAAAPIKYRNLPSTRFNRADKFKLASSMRDGWPMGAKHFGKKVLRDQ
jgi:hypothetical protein